MQRTELPDDFPLRGACRREGFADRVASGAAGCLYKLFRIKTTDSINILLLDSLNAQASDQTYVRPQMAKSTGGAGGSDGRKGREIFSR